MPNYQSSQQLHPFHLLTQLSNLETTGCLQMLSGSITWLIYLEQGKLIYAWNSIDPFERLARHLDRITPALTNLIDPIQIQIQLLAETSINQQFCLGSDYQSICWLVKHEYLNEKQAAALIENLAVEVIESFSIIKESNYRLLEPDEINDLPIFCRLDPGQLVENNQSYLWQNQITKFIPTLQPNFQTAYQVRKNGKFQETDRTSFQEMPESIVASCCDFPPLSMPSDNSHYTIVCIDDSPTFLRTMDDFLQNSNFSVLTIADPLKALIDLVQSKPNLILLDIDMPNLDGYELCSLLRKHPFFQHIPVIMVTGYNRIVDRARAKLAGASDYLTKPFTQSELLQLVFKHLE